MKEVFNRELVIVALAVPVLLFLLSRMTSFFNEVWGIGFDAVTQAAVLFAGIAGVFFFRKKIKVLLDGSAYGFSSIAITIYLLSVLLCFKYKAIVYNGCARQGIDCILGGGLLLGFFVLLAVKGTDAFLQKLRTPSRSCVVFFVAAGLILNIQAVLYCTFMKEIFVWDNAGYFVTVHKLNDIFPSAEYFKAVYESVFQTDYNYIISVPASIFCKLLGESRLVFVLSVVNCYLLPLVTLVYAAAKRIFKSGTAGVFAVLALPYVIFAANAGFIDIGGAFFALLAAVIFLWGDGEEMSVITGILLALCVLMRRWYSFYAISFIVTAFVWGISHKKIKSCVYTLLSFAFVLLFFAQPFVSGKLMADYSDMYSAYVLGVGTDIKLFTRYFGAALTVAVGVWAISRQYNARKKMTPELFVLLQGMICFALFTALQSHGQQHLALYVPMFIILILSLLSGAKNKKVIYAAVCVLCVAQTVSTFVPREQPRSISEIKRISVLPSFSVYPPVDENAEDYLELTEYMDSEIGMNGKTVCFLASSLEMNYDTLRNAEASLSVKKKYDIDRESYYLIIGDVDKRDGLSDNLFAADYILVPSRLQVHLVPEEQRVISVPYNHIINGTGFGTAYEKQEKLFTLSSGDEIYVYKKTRDITSQEKESLYKEIFK